MQDWLTRFSAALVREFPALPAGLSPSPELADDLLSLARIVAEGTGQKTNAPLTSYMVGYLACFLAGDGAAPEAAVERATQIAGSLLNAEH